MIQELKGRIEQYNNLEHGMALFDHIGSSLNANQQAPSTSPPDDVGEITASPSSEEIAASPRSEEVIVNFDRAISCQVVITPPRVKIFTTCRLR